MQCWAEGRVSTGRGQSIGRLLHVARGRKPKTLETSIISCISCFVVMPPTLLRHSSLWELQKHSYMLLRWRGQ